MARQENRKPKGALPTEQARSAATRDRLLDAAEALLAAGGLEACTVPSIAQMANVAVGTVYRRFPDKDTLLRATFERFLDRSVAQNAGAEACVPSSLSLEQRVAAVVGSLMHGLDTNRVFLSAYFEYAERHADATFRARAERAREQTVPVVSAMLRERASDIRHEDIEAATAFIVRVLSTVTRVAVLDQRQGWGAVSRETLTRELIRMTTAYLTLPGVPGEETQAAARGARRSPRPS